MVWNKLQLIKYIDIMIRNQEIQFPVILHIVIYIFVFQTGCFIWSNFMNFNIILIGSMDPYARAPRSPKLKTVKTQGVDSLAQPYPMNDDCKSPTNDPVST